MIMFCSKCGKQLNDGDVFCSGCGAQVGASTPQPVPSQPVQPQFLATLNGVQFDLVQVEQLFKLHQNRRRLVDVIKYVREKANSSLSDAQKFVDHNITHNATLKAHLDTIYAQQQEDFNDRKRMLEESGAIHCPKCLSQNFDIQKKGFSLGKSVAGIFGFGVAGAVAGAHGANKLKYKCLDCGHDWQE